MRRWIYYAGVTRFERPSSLRRLALAALFMTAAWAVFIFLLERYPNAIPP